MFENKGKILVIIAVFTVIALGVGIYIQNIPAQPSNTDYPIVMGNPSPSYLPARPEPETPKEPEKNYSQVDLPPSDSTDENSFLIEEEEPVPSEPSEISEEERGLPELEHEEVKQINEQVKLAVQEAKNNPDVMQLPIAPAPAPEPEPEVETGPKKGADGYYYTKEEAIKIAAETWKKFVAENDFNYTIALEGARQNSSFSQERFDAEFERMLTDPYSSPTLAYIYDRFREDGPDSLGTLILVSTGWMVTGWDDAVLADRSN